MKATDRMTYARAAQVLQEMATASEQMKHEQGDEIDMQVIMLLDEQRMALEIGAAVVREKASPRVEPKPQPGVKFDA